MSSTPAPAFTTVKSLVSDLLTRLQLDRLWRTIKAHKLLKCVAGVAALLAIRELYMNAYRKYYHLPPGPNGLPFVGSFLTILWTPARTLRYCHRYGPIYLMYTLGGLPVIMLSDTQLIKQLYAKKELWNRFAFTKATENSNYYPLWTVGEHRTESMASLCGQEWIERRKYAQTTLFRAMNNKYLNELLTKCLLTSLKPFLEHTIHEQKGLWYPRKFCEYIAFNTIFQTVFGESLDRDSDLYRIMNEDLMNTMKYTVTDIIATLLPIFRHWPNFVAPVKKTRQRRNQTIKDLIHKRLELRSSATTNINKTYTDLAHELVDNGDISLEAQIADTFFYFVAGVDTTSSTLTYALVLLAKPSNNHIQTLVRNEISQYRIQSSTATTVNENENDNDNDNGNVNDIAADSDALSTYVFDLKQLNQCPMFRAMVHEILRISSIVFHGVHHCNAENDDTWIEVEMNQNQKKKKYKLPKNSLISTDTTYMHTMNANERAGNGRVHQESWKKVDRDAIYLENFLSDDKTRFVVNESLMAFGTGRRNCIGKALAVKELYIVLSFLLLNYSFELPRKFQSEATNIVKEFRGATALTAFIDPPIPVIVAQLNKQLIEFW